MNTNDNSISVQIAPPFMGHITPGGVINAKGTIEFKTNYSQVGKGYSGSVFIVTAPGYQFEVGFTDEFFYIERNSCRLEYPLRPVFMPHGAVHFFARWSLQQLRLTVIDESFHQTIENQSELDSNTAEVERRTLTLETPPTLPPNSLIAWARMQAILPTTFYDSKESFNQTVTSSLESIQNLVTSLGSVNPFWDITYEGPSIANRLPKREPDIQPTIRALLFNIAIAKNLEITPEYPISGGNLDFLVTGPLSTGEICFACIEFKLAHSEALLNGLLEQLPIYMKGKACDFGIYAVLFFKGEFFDEPSGYDTHRLRLFLEKERRKAGLRNILVWILDVSHVPKPSRR
jgi:hypothetical protein